MTDKDTPRKVNECRTARVAEVLADFRALQYYISAGPVEPENEEDYYTEGWAALRQCTIDGQYILDVAADTRVPAAQGGEEEQTRAELQQYVLSTCEVTHLASYLLIHSIHSSLKMANFPFSKGSCLMRMRAGTRGRKSS